jgi:hypothetical protein
VSDRHPSPTATRRANAYLAPKPTSPPTIEVSNIWVNPNPSNLLAKCSVVIPRWGETINGCSVVRTKVGGYFVLPPGIPMLGRDGTVLKDDAGKTRFSPAVVFSKAAGRRFSNAVLEALRRQRPELLDGGSAG